MSCTYQKKGNIFTPHLPTDGPVSGTVEKVCKEKTGNGETVSRQSAHFYSSSAPKAGEQEAIRSKLESSVQKGNGSFLNWGANVLQSVLGGPPQRRYASSPAPASVPSLAPVSPTPVSETRIEDGHLFPHDTGSVNTILEEQKWPEPNYDDIKVTVDYDRKSGGNKKPLKKRSAPLKKKSSLKKGTKEKPEKVEKKVSSKKPKPLSKKSTQRSVNKRRSGRKNTI